MAAAAGGGLLAAAAAARAPGGALPARARPPLALLAALLAGVAYGALAARPPRAARLADHPRGAAGPWQARGRLATDPLPLGGAWQVDLSVETLRVDGVWRDWPLRVRATVYGAPGTAGWSAGAGFETFLSLRPQRGVRNPLVPERPDLRASGADVRASLKSFRQLRRRQPAPAYRRWRSTARTALRAAITARFGDDAGLVHALVLGERGALEPGLDDALARTGLVHLLAISGLHVGIVVGAAFALMRAAGLARPRAALAVAGALPLLHALVVPRAPVSRAALMAAIVLLAMAAGRRGAALNGLALATLVLTASDPWLTRNFGFQLSSAATAGILLLVRLPRRGRSPGGWLLAALAVSAAAQLAVAPRVAAASFRLPLVSLPLNVVAVPLTAVALITALAALGGTALHCPPLATPAAGVARLALGGLRRLTRAADGHVAALTVPAAAVPWVSLAALALALLLANSNPAGSPAVGRGRRAAATSGARGPRLARGALAIVTVLLVGAAAGAVAMPPPRVAAAFRLVAFDVGQGDALLVEAGTRRLLVDTAGSPTSAFDPGTTLLSPALRARGIDRLDAVVITHLHADHVGGLAGLLAEIDAAAVWTAPFDADGPAGRAFAAARAGVPLRVLRRGDPAPLDGGDCRWQVLHPPRSGRSPAGRPPANDDSLVLSLQCGRHALLLTGDSERPAEDAYAPGLMLPAGTLLKSPHHGSATSSSEALLDATAARHVVVSAGWRNRFGLPDAEVLERYRAHRMAVYRTDRDGAVSVTAGARLRVRGERWTAGRGRIARGGWLY